MDEQKRPAAPGRTTPGFAFSILERCLYDGVALRKFGTKEMDEVLAFFGVEPPECAFCGGKSHARWDHLIAVMRGGDTTLGNMVPACGPCDDSKQHRPWEEWLRSRPVKDVDARVAKLNAYVAKYGYTPKSFEQRLTAEHLATLRKIQEKAKALRREIEDLVADVRAHQ